MAFLKETERSLRVYFIIVGTIGTLLALSGLGDASEGSPVTTSMLAALAIWFPPLAHLVLASIHRALSCNHRSRLADTNANIEVQRWKLTISACTPKERMAMMETNEMASTS